MLLIYGPPTSSQQLLRLNSMKVKLIATILFFYSALGFAGECTTNNETTFLNIPDLTIRRDTPIGTEIGALSTTIDAFSCTKGFSYQEFGIKGYGTAAPKINGLNIYKLGSNSAGIGYAIYANSPNTCNNYLFPLKDGDYNLFCFINGTFSKKPIQGYIKLVFYKIGNITPGRKNGYKVASLILRNNKNDWHNPESYLHTTPFTVITHGCTIKTANIKVPLDNIETHKLSNIGMTAAEKPFSIPLNCDTGTKVKLTLDAGPTGVYDNTKGLLNLSDPASVNTAQGVKIQILSNNEPVTFGKSLDVGVQTIEGAFDIPLQARYYRSVEKLKAGEANATTTYTITYE